MRHSVLLVVTLSLIAPQATAEEPPSTRLTCQRQSSPGRVSCELELEVDAGRELAWGDALVLEAPDFSLPLRARVGPRAATDRTERRLRLPLSFAATREGAGIIVVDARSVVCSARRACLPYRARARARLEVGPIQEGS